MNRQHFTVPTEQQLPVEMGYLLPTNALQDWADAVTRAAQLLAPAWGDGDRPALRTLTFTLYTLGHEHGQPAGDVALDAMRDALSGRKDYDGEPMELKDRIRAVLETQGHVSHTDRTFKETAVYRIYRDLTYQWEPREIMSDMGAGPSHMQHAAGRLTGLLAELDDVQAAGLPAAPTPTGPVTVKVAGKVFLISYGGGGAALQFVQCGECEQHHGGSVLVDGSNVTFTCGNGHATNDRRLTATRVRNALTPYVSPATGVQLTAGAEGEVSLGGDLRVARDDMMETANPLGGYF
ncbi:hypothetical protein ACMATS_06175 [Streptoverticillium reticulum]|uniref:hypothetical protein n=1 Tax=Streptoverticillium reticulum TaxID=1433415 RepID=UPI0039BEFCD2